ncbi:MAG: hypothetical protein R3Y30_20055, partial [Vibrio sp.]
MHPSFYMLEKELIEHKINTRLPLFIGLCGFLLFVSLFFSGQAQHDFFFQMEVNGDVSSMHRDFSRDLNSVIYFGAGLISLLLSTLYIPKTLRKERQEGSSMFWRSMPVSNAMTHAVKRKPLKWEEVLLQVNFLASSPCRTTRVKTTISIRTNLVEF